MASRERPVGSVPDVSDDLRADPSALAAEAAGRWAEVSGAPRHDVALVMGSGWVPAADALAFLRARLAN